MSIQDSQKSIEFLKLFYPTQFWVLTAIRPDKKGIDTETFNHKKEKECKKWLDEYNGKRNLYFSVNQPIKAVDRKINKDQINSVNYFHVDIDPRVGEDLEEEKTRILKLLDNLPDDIPPITCLVYSGGGYNAYWKLDKPILVEGDQQKVAEAERFNRYIESVFNADHCFNLDRIMRLPHTLNIPDAVKIKKGRVPVVSELLRFDEKIKYSTDKFKKAPVIESPSLGDRPVSRANVIKLQDIKHLKNVEELNKWGVSDRVKVLIVQGCDPDDEEKYPSRSEALFDACCQLIRAGVPDDVIFAVITDPGFRISESVLETKSRATKYATRQIERAKEEADDPWLRKLNEKHAVIRNWGGKCRIIEEVYDYALKRTKLTKQSFPDFTNSYMNQYVTIQNEKGVPSKIPIGKWWLQHPKRRQYNTLVFLPGQEIEGTYNLWTGFICEAIQGDCSLLMNHIKDNICGDVEEYYNYLIGWMARCVQHPDSQGHTAIVMRGKEGTGKSIFARSFGSLWGRHFLPISDPKHLVGSFNAHLRDCVVLFGDEAFYAGDKKHESILKTLVTEDTITIEPKGVDMELCSNFTHLLLASNGEWVIPAGGDARRYFVLDVLETHMQDSRYFIPIKKQLDSGGREALLHYLINYDLANFNVQDVPKTSALQEQKIYSLGPIEEWWYQKLFKGLLLRKQDHWTGSVVCDKLINDYVEYSKAFNIARRGNETMLNKFLDRINPGKFPKREFIVGAKSIMTDNGFDIEVQQNQLHYVFPSLKKCREFWEKSYGTVDWSPEPSRQKEIGDESPF